MRICTGFIERATFHPKLIPKPSIGLDSRNCWPVRGPVLPVGIVAPGGMQVCVRTLVGKNLSIDLDESPDTATVAMIKEALQVCFLAL